MKYLSWLIAILFIGCSTNKKHIKKGTQAQTTPPGCVRINTNLLVDYQEISNFSWLEYQYWQKRMYGVNSPEFRAAQPDTNVWLQRKHFSPKLAASYLKDPDMRDLPVVGVSHNQAKAYASWRSDRVTEILLIKAGYLDVDPNRKLTIASLREGKIKLKKELPNHLKFPRYRLLTVKEYDQVLGKHSSTALVNHKVVSRQHDYIYQEARSNEIANPTTNKLLAVSYLMTSYNELLDGGMLIRHGKNKDGKPYSKTSASNESENGLIGFRNACEWEYLFPQN